MQNKYFLSLIGVLCCALLCPSYVKAATYYISNSGNDANNGTSISTPWQTIAKVNSQTFQAGDQILFEGGSSFPGQIYLDASDISSPSNPIIISSYGTGVATITASSASDQGLYAYNIAGIYISNLNFLGGGISGSAGINFYSDYMDGRKLDLINIENVTISNYRTGILIGSWPSDNNPNDSGYTNVTIQNSTIHDTFHSGISIYGFFPMAIGVFNHENVVIANNHVYNIQGDSNFTSNHTGSGIVIGQVDGAMMERNLVHDGGYDNSTCGGPVGLWAWDCNDVTIQFNEVYGWSSGSGCDGGGFDFDGGITNSVMQYNYSHDNEGPGYLIGNFGGSRPLTNNIIRYNISENDATEHGGGITLFNAPGTSFDGVEIYNNTIYSGTNSGNSIRNANWGNNIQNTNIYNNIFYSESSSEIVRLWAGNTINFYNNAYYKPSGNYSYRFDGTNYSSLANWQSATSQETYNSSNIGFEGVDPQLTSPGNGGAINNTSLLSSLNAYKLQDTSPLINEGLNLNSEFGLNIGSIDFFENNSLKEGFQDIGAYEKNSSPCGECLNIQILE